MMILSATADAGGQIYNTSRFTFDSLHQQEASELRENLIDYISGFSLNIRSFSPLHILSQRRSGISYCLGLLTILTRTLKSRHLSISILADCNCSQGS